MHENVWKVTKMFMNDKVNNRAQWKGTLPFNTIINTFWALPCV